MLPSETVQIAERPVVEPLSRLVERRRWGLLKQVRLPVWLEVSLAVALMDYTPYLYLWLLEIMFHHSNVDLPPAMERRLNRILVRGADGWATRVGEAVAGTTTIRPRIMTG